MPTRQDEPDPDEEQRLLDEAMADVTPLPKDHRLRVRPQPRIPKSSVERPYHPPPERSRDAELTAADDAAYVARGVDRRELRKLRRGQYVPGRRLDLHGLTRKDALAEAAAFVEINRQAYRCVAIVHGRGLHSAGNTAVVRDAVRGFLREHPAVLAYTDAPRDDGGSGAVYVLLRSSSGQSAL
jgi:DNA-nicking Smr family endonuclease